MENHFSSAWFTFILLFFRICFFSIFFPHNFFPCVLQNFCLRCLSMPSSLGCFMLCCELGLPPHRGFCFLSQVHVAHIQIAPGRARPPVCWTGQPALQAGLRWQDQQPAAGSGGAHQAAVKRGRCSRQGGCGNSKAGQCEKGVSWPSHLCSVSAVPFSDVRTQRASHTSSPPKSCLHPLCSKN